MHNDLTVPNEITLFKKMTGCIFSKENVREKCIVYYT